MWYSIVQFQLKTVPVKKQFQLKTVPVKNNFSASAFLRSVSTFQLVCLSLSVYLVYLSLSVYLLVFISRFNLVFFRKMSWYNFASETLESILVGAVGSAVAKGVDVACKWYTSDTPPPVPDSAGELTAHPIIELVAEPIVVTEEELPSVSSFVTAYDNGQCAICQGPQENKSYPPCGHVFCFECLLECSKRRKTCPLCRALMDSFKHSIESEDNFKVHSVQIPISVKLEFILDYCRELFFLSLWALPAITLTFCPYFRAMFTFE